MFECTVAKNVQIEGSAIIGNGALNGGALSVVNTGLLHISNNSIVANNTGCEMMMTMMIMMMMMMT